MKRIVSITISLFVLGAIALTACGTPAPVATEAPAATEAAVPAQTEPVSIEYWVFSDYATGVGGDLQNTFISEFEAAHPGVTINMIGKGGDELNTATVAAAASNTIPDLFMNSTSNGALFVSVNALNNVYDAWNAEPEAFRAQFNPQMISDLSPVENTMWGVPYTGYATFLYRNLDVLAAAGIDPATPITDWNVWKEQIQAVGQAGFTGLPYFYDDWWNFTNIYSGAATAEQWGIDFANNTTRIDRAAMISTLNFLSDTKPYRTDLGMQDQGATDMFLAGQLAFLPGGPWMDPTFKEAATNSGLKYDYVLTPGLTADNKGGIGGIEYIGFAPNNPDFDIAWQFAMYIMDEPQMVRWTQALGRYNSNNTAMAEVSDPLLTITVEAGKSALMERPPHFTEAYPGDYFQTLQDFLAQIDDGTYTIDAGVDAMITALNEVIANR